MHQFGLYVQMLLSTYDGLGVFVPYDAWAAQFGLDEEGDDPDIKYLLDRYFYLLPDGTDSNYGHHRIDKEFNDLDASRERLSEARKNAGIAGARARWGTEGNGKPMANDSKNGYTETKTKTNTTKKEKTNKKENWLDDVDHAEWFETWWTAYANKQGIKLVKAALNRIKPNAVVMADIMDHTTRYVAVTPKQYRKLPATYLNQEAWTDEVIDRETSKPVSDRTALTTRLHREAAERAERFKDVPLWDENGKPYR